MARARDSLEPGTVLDCYRVVDTIGKGGFSLIYLAENEETGDEVVIKEFMPKRLARRHADGRLLPVDNKQREALYRSRRLFFQEAKVMASLAHPHIVAVLNLIMRNDTGYIVMQHERGRNLGQFVHERGGGLSTTLMSRIFVPLLDALNTMHARAMLHLDVKPGNIHLRNGHDPLLLDLGAAQVLTIGGSTASHVITAGYSPPEQYRHGGKIGPWTDVYAVGASLRCCIDGKTPPPAPDRLADDTLVPALEQYANTYPHWLLELIDRSMSLVPEERPRDAGEMLQTMRHNAAVAQVT
ncbi:serine/threonine-protein kinase [uncultured Thiohalocapsa sp.]|uniref:serine/threonine protein kinase n=1 Tax=uncultured Thiohalocapsa sp. TaxID=768990 RepID=UPI0025F56962|nr:serine/threonine-protein kinase [uncultured Thiohalocapsa sp.]